MADQYKNSTWKLPTLDVSPPPRLPALTLLYHPELSRIGQRAGLIDLAVDPLARLQLSRLHLGFGPPGSLAGDPINDPYVSRRPALLSPDGAGGVCIETQPRGLILAMDHGGKTRVLDGRSQFPASVLDAGGVRLIACASDDSGTLRPRVVFLLHRVRSVRQDVDDMGLVGGSDAIDDVRSEVQAVAPHDANVLVLGPTGSGKELVAHAIHAKSGRATRPFVAASMGEIAGETGRSELFGHERGAFTHANSKHSGLFAQARDGTLFLDEIGETRPEVQAMLLRALQERVVRPLGSSREVPVRARLIAATDKDLDAAASKRTFDAALLNRLQGYVVRVPALSERPDDVARLAMHFVTTAVGPLTHGQTRAAAAEPWFPPALMLELLRHDWPGNVRQLRNVISQVVIGSGSNRTLGIRGATRELLGDDAAHSADTDGPSASMLPRAAIDVPERTLLAALERQRWRPNAAARELGISRSTIYRLMRGSSQVRMAKDIPDSEFRAAWNEAGGDVERLVDSLRVSARAIKLRATELGL